MTTRALTVLAGGLWAVAAVMGWWINRQVHAW